MTVLRGGGRLATKINITFLVGIDVLNIFYLTTFSEKNIFSKITAKNYFGRRDHFWGSGASDDKNEYNLFFLVNVVPSTVFKFFSQKTPFRLTKTRKTGFGGTFSPISVVLLGRLFPKTIGFTHESTHANRANFMKICSKLGPVS